MFASQIGGFSSFNIGRRMACDGFLPSTAHACGGVKHHVGFVQFEHFTQCLFISDIRDYVAYFALETILSASKLRWCKGVSA
jgi:hypothetical protein